jgi:predicted Zn-dependent peptidase
MVMRPTLPVGEFEKEKAVIMEELKMYKDLPQSYVHELLDDLLWPGHPLGMGVIGFEDSLAALKRDDLRRYRDRQYIPSGIVISAAGALEHSELCAKAERLFAVKSAAHPVAPENFLPVVPEESKAPVFKLLRKETEQTHIALGFRAFSREHPSRYASTLLHIIMGANMSSRLFHEVREKRGLAYEIGTQMKRYHDTGAFVVHAGIDNKKLSSALEVIMAELRRIKSVPPAAAELTRAKEYFLGQLMLALEDCMDQMLFIGEAVTMEGRIHTYEKITEGILAVSGKDIKNAAAAILKEENIRFAAIGSAVDDESSLRKSLKL